jgi:hypothetical protein
LELQDVFGWIDGSVIDYVEQLIEGTGLRMWFISTFDQTTAIVVLTPDEEVLILRARPQLFATEM